MEHSLQGSRRKGSNELTVAPVDESTKSSVIRMRKALFEYLVSQDDWLPPSSHRSVDADLEDPKCLILVAVKDGCPIATLSASWDSSGWAMLKDGWVDPGNRRKGVMRVLTDAAERELTAVGAHHVAVKYQSSNIVASASWASIGFEPTTVIATKELS